MNISNSTPLLPGWIVGKIEPPQWTASFFLKGTFALGAEGTLAWAEEPRQLSGDVYADDDLTKDLLYPSDFAPIKPKADIILSGTAFAPGSQPVPSFPISFRIGKLQKTLTVFGERKWKTGLISTSGTTPPGPIAALPLTYRHAFGGPAFAENPLGRGRKSDLVPAIEDPNRPVRGPSDNVEPAGFGPIPAAWPQRANFRGTYDKEWLKNRWPWFPKDFNWSYFNAAPRDQQFDGYLVGNEELEFENLHPERPIMKSRLPGMRPRCFVADRSAQGEKRFREVPLVLDTLWADVGAGVLVLLWRGRLEVRTMKLREVDRIVVVAEPLAEKPLPTEHYRNAPSTAVGPAPEVPEELPPHVEFPTAAMDAELAEMEKSFADLEIELAEAQAAIEGHVAKKKAAMIASGVDPSLFAAPDSSPDPSALASLDAVVAKLRDKSPEMVAQVEQHRAFIAEAENGFASLGGELDAMETELEANQVAFQAGLTKPWTRERVEAAVAAGQSLARENLQELDLSGLTLSRVDLRNASLAKTNLTGCRLDDSDMRGADLSGANLAKADLSRAKLDGADLTEAQVPEATFGGISLTNATLNGVDLSGADLSGCRADGANFAGVNLFKANLDHASLTQADFTEANLESASLIGATLRAAQCEHVKAKGIKCNNADLTGLHGSGGSDFTGGSFQKIRGEGAIFAESILDEVDFTAARLVKAQFGDASLRGAIFDRTDLSHAMFDDADMSHARLTHANLLQAGLDRALLVEADCRGANFYEAGFWDALIEKSNFREANLKGTLLRGTN